MYVSLSLWVIHWCIRFMEYLCSTVLRNTASCLLRKMYLNLFLRLVFQECLGEGSCGGWCVAYLRAYQQCQDWVPPNILHWFWVPTSWHFFECRPRNLLSWSWTSSLNALFLELSLLLLSYWTSWLYFWRRRVCCLICNTAMGVSGSSKRGYLIPDMLTKKRWWILCSALKINFIIVVIVYVTEYHQKEQWSWFLRSGFKCCILQDDFCKLKVF